MIKLKKISVITLTAAVWLSSGVTHAQTQPENVPLQEIVLKLQEQIQALQTQIRELKIKIQSQGQELAAVKLELYFTKTLAPGTTGEDVQKLQEFLRKFPDVYPEGVVSGYFGRLTELAVKRFQEKYELEPVGVVGPKTRALLNEIFVSPTRITPFGTIPAQPAEPIGQTGTTTVPALPAQPVTHESATSSPVTESPKLESATSSPSSVTLPTGWPSIILEQQQFIKGRVLVITTSAGLKSFTIVQPNGATYGGTASGCPKEYSSKVNFPSYDGLTATLTTCGGKTHEYTFVLLPSGTYAGTAAAFTEIVSTPITTSTTTTSLSSTTTIASTATTSVSSLSPCILKLSLGKTSAVDGTTAFTVGEKVWFKWECTPPETRTPYIRFQVLNSAGAEVSYGGTLIAYDWRSSGTTAGSHSFGTVGFLPGSYTLQACLTKDNLDAYCGTLGAITSFSMASSTTATVTQTQTSTASGSTSSSGSTTSSTQSQTTTTSTQTQSSTSTASSTTTTSSTSSTSTETTSTAASTGAAGTQKWAFATGNDIYSSPALASDGTIYIGSFDQKLYAVNSNGTLKWSFSVDGNMMGSPVIASDGTIYVGTTYGKLYALDPGGNQKWIFEEPSTANNRSIVGAPALASDGTIYFSSKSAKTYAINPNGTQKWVYDAGGEYAPAVASDGTVYINGWNKLFAVNSDGTLKWSYGPSSYVFGSSSSLDSDGTIYIGCAEANPWRYWLCALRSDGTVKWKSFTNTGHFYNTAIGVDGTLYTTDRYGKLYAFTQDGVVKWTFSSSVGKISNLGATVGADGTIYVGAYESKLYAINPDGTQKWAFQTSQRDVMSSPVIGSDGTVYIGAYDGKLYAIYSDSLGLANSPWPKHQKNNRNTGNASDPIALRVPVNSNLASVLQSLSAILDAIQKQIQKLWRF